WSAVLLVVEADFHRCGIECAREINRPHGSRDARGTAGGAPVLVEERVYHEHALAHPFPTLSIGGNSFESRACRSRVSLSGVSARSVGALRCVSAASIQRHIGTLAVRCVCFAFLARTKVCAMF